MNIQLLAKYLELLITLILELTDDAKSPFIYVSSLFSELFSLVTFIVES